MHRGIELLVVDSPPPSLREGAARGKTSRVGSAPRKQSPILALPHYLARRKERKRPPVELHFGEPVFVAVGSDVGGGLLEERILGHVGLDQLDNCAAGNEVFRNHLDRHATWQNVCLETKRIIKKKRETSPLACTSYYLMS